MPPYRTGIPTLRTLLRHVCRLLTQYREVVETFLTPTQLIYWDALLQACNDFVMNIDHPNKGD